MADPKSNLKDLLTSYQEALEFFSVSLSQNDETAKKIQAANVKQPLDELAKITKLIKAHTTKVGIIFKPENLAKSTDPAFSTLSKLSESVVLMISVVAQIDPREISNLFYKEIVDHVRLILEGNKKLVEELLIHTSEGSTESTESTESAESVKSAKSTESTESAKSTKDSPVDSSVDSSNSVNGRLLSVGLIWTCCDSTMSLLESGNLNLLTSKIKESILLIDDGFEEFVEWAENPEEFEMEDPFGFSDDESDDEPPADSDNESTDGESKDVVAKFAKTWIKKIELIKLLLSSLKKSLPATTTGESIDSIYSHESRLVNLIDKLVVDLMLDQVVDEVVEKCAEDITEVSQKISTIVRKLHKDNEKKAKWYETWETKFNDN